jgi:hypothetical protein
MEKREFGTLTAEFTYAIACITLNRPDRLNAIREYARATLKKSRASLSVPQGSVDLNLRKNLLCISADKTYYALSCPVCILKATFTAGPIADQSCRKAPAELGLRPLAHGRRSRVCAYSVRC